MTAIRLERLVDLMRHLKEHPEEEFDKATDADVVAYLCSASCEAPLNGDATNVYLHLAAQVYQRWRAKDSGVDFLSAFSEGDIPKELSISEKQMLNELKRDMFRDQMRGKKG